MMEKLDTSDTEYFIVSVKMPKVYHPDELYDKYLWFRKENGITSISFNNNGYIPIPNILYEAILNLRKKGFYKYA